MVLKADWQAGDPYTADDANDVADEVNGLASSVASGLSGKADKSTAITAGTGLTGGGDLSANRTLAVAFGSSGSTACAGNDARLADQRTPGDNTVTTAKLQNNAVTTGKIADAQVTVAKFASDVTPAMQGVAATRRTTSATSTGTLTVNVDTTDEAYLTAQTAALTLAAPTGTAAAGRKIIVSVYSAAAQTLTFNAVFRGDLPASTEAGKTMYLGFSYHAGASKWDLLAKQVIG